MKRYLVMLAVVALGVLPAAVAAEVNDEIFAPWQAWDGDSSTAGLPEARSDAGAPESPPVSLEVKPEEAEDYDPWEPFNERTFEFNRQLDRVVLKPAATGWSKVVPDGMRQRLQNAFRNVGMPRRFVNNFLQLKVEGATQELARFLINSTVGIAGFFDVAKGAGLAESDEDTGQTLGAYGVGPGPYLIFPFFPPLTVRDALGSVVDGALDPLNYLLPLAGKVGTKAGTTVNDRSLNLELFQDVEESALDLYTAVRNGYLQHRQKAIQE